MSLKLGDASFEGCVVRVINESAGRAFASGAGFAATLAAGRFVSLVWRGGEWAVESGDGYVDEGGVFHVRSAAGLKAWAAYMEETSDWSVSCALDACVDMAGVEWLPVGTEENPYTGRFDGGGHSIRNLTIETSEYQNTGFIGYMSGDAEVRNLALVDCSVALTWSQSSAARAGGIAGCMAAGAVTGCQVSGQVSATSSSGSARAGGIAGYMATGTSIARCVNEAAVTAKATSSAAYTYAIPGGIVGQMAGGTFVAWCANLGAVYGSSVGSYVRGGGVAGIFSGSSSAYSAIAYCVNKGTVTGSSGGGTSLLGYMAGDRNATYSMLQYNTRLAGPTSEAGRTQ